jgi:cell wall-associated NlpC family hydrolase
MDCSNTSRWLYQEVKALDLPRTASDQYEWLRQRRRLWKARPDPCSLRKKLQPGDLLFWENTCKPPRRPPITHVMVYLGTDASGRMLMAGSQGSSGPDIYDFDPGKRMGGYRFFLFFRRDGKFVAYGRP